jgi:transcription elongation factor SPT5
LKGSIYVEAFKEANVREAIEGIASLRENGLKIVPLDEMTAVFNYDKVEKYDIKNNQWVRLKSGVYDGDLAQVVKVEDSINKIYVRTIPRLGDVKIEERKEDSFKKVNKNMIPHQKLFNPTLYKDAEKKTNFKNFDNVYLWNKLIFDMSGFLIKPVKAKSLVLDGVEPKLEELKIFNTTYVEESNYNDHLKESFDSLNIENLNLRKSKFQKGDKIKVVKSSLMNLTGIVENYSNGIVQIIPTNLDDFNDILEIPEEHVVKNFMPGDNIRVNI